jgi:hypothetical protein
MKYGVCPKILPPATIVTAVPFCDEISETTSPFRQGDPYYTKGILRPFFEVVKGLGEGLGEGQVTGLGDGLGDGECPLSKSRRLTFRSPAV